MFIPAARIFFTQPDVVKDHLQKVLFYHRETDTLSTNIKRKIFQEFETLKLSEKTASQIFLRYTLNKFLMFQKMLPQQLSSLVIKMKM